MQKKFWTLLGLILAVSEAANAQPGGRDVAYSMGDPSTGPDAAWATVGLMSPFIGGAVALLVAIFGDKSKTTDYGLFAFGITFLVSLLLRFMEI